MGTVTVTIMGEVLQNISSNLTGAYLDLWDGSVSIPLTENLTGTVLSSLPVGSPIRMIGAVAVGLQALPNTQCQLLGELFKSTLTAKQGTNTYIRLVYSTTNNPCSGQIRFTTAWYSGGAGAGVMNPP